MMLLRCTADSNKQRSFSPNHHSIFHHRWKHLPLRTLPRGIALVRGVAEILQPLRFERKNTDLLSPRYKYVCMHLLWQWQARRTGHINQAKWRHWPAGDCTTAIHLQQGITTDWGGSAARSAQLRPPDKSREGKETGDISHLQYRQ